MNTKSIYDSKILLVVLLFLLVEPGCFATFTIIDNIYTFASMAISLLLLINIIRTKKISKVQIFVFLFYGTLILATVFGTGHVYLCLKAFIPQFAMCLLFDLYLRKNPVLLVDVFDVLEIYIYLNLLTIILFPGGLYSTERYDMNWFLGYKNIQIRTILPIISLSMIKSYWKSDKINVRTIVLLVVSGITMVFLRSATSLVGFVVFIGLLILFLRRKKELPRFINMMTILGITVVLFYLTVVLKIQDKFTSLLLNILGRSATFTGRTHIWDEAIELVLKKPFLGYGYLTGNEYVSFFGNVNATHPHNYFLYIMMSGGLMLLAVFLYGYVLVHMRIEETRNSVYSKIIMFTISAFLIMGLTESLTGTILLYPMFIIGMESNYLLRLPKPKKTKRKVRVKIRG